MAEPMITETLDWVDFTPGECTYDLLMSDPGGSGIQQIELTRDEFIDLKAALAAIRQIKPVVPAGKEKD